MCAKEYVAATKLIFTSHLHRAPLASSTLSPLPPPYSLRHLGVHHSLDISGLLSSFGLSAFASLSTSPLIVCSRVFILCGVERNALWQAQNFWSSITYTNRILPSTCAVKLVSYSQCRYLRLSLGLEVTICLLSPLFAHSPPWSRQRWILLLLCYWWTF